jgi:hypothetical protein
MLAGRLDKYENLVGFDRKIEWGFLQVRLIQIGRRDF